MLWWFLLSSDISELNVLCSVSNIQPAGRMPPMKTLSVATQQLAWTRKITLPRYAASKGKGKVDDAPVWSIGGVLISLSVAVSP